MSFHLALFFTSKLLVLVLVVLLLLDPIPISAASDKNQEHSSHLEVSYVSYGSSFKLVHVDSGYRLHSHDVKYGSGSQQQSVTGFPENADPNSLWTVKPGLVVKNNNNNNNQNVNTQVQQGAFVKCGDTIRLEHVNTGKNLHSHNIRSPLSKMQEVSAWGFREKETNLDDNFVLECVDTRRDPNGKDDSHLWWQRYEHVLLRHATTNMYLGASIQHKYRDPIPGQLEIIGTHKRMPKMPDIKWRTDDGIFFFINK